MYCPACKAVVGDTDAFCSKCGAGVTLATRGQSAQGRQGGAGVTPATGGQSAQGPQGAAGVTPATGGRWVSGPQSAKYPQLSRYAANLINHAEMLRVVAGVLSVFGGILALVGIFATLRPLMGNDSTSAAVIACVVSAGVSFIAWIWWERWALLVGVLGELLYLLMDMEENTRLRS